MNLNKYAVFCGQSAEANGWHKRFKVDIPWGNDDAAMIDHLVAKTALIGCEVAEAIEELRDGASPYETYYTDGGKPEGFPSELADIIIRALDLAYMLGIDIDAIFHEKLEYNATRGQMHGGKTI